MSEQLSSNLRENKVLDNKKRMRVGAFTANVFKQNGGDALANPEGSRDGLNSYSPYTQG